MKKEDFTTSLYIDLNLGVEDFFNTLFNQEVTEELLDNKFRKMLNEEMAKDGVLKECIKEKKLCYEYNIDKVAEWLIENSDEIKTQFKRYLREKARYATYVVENY